MNAASWSLILLERALVIGPSGGNGTARAVSPSLKDILAYYPFLKMDEPDVLESLVLMDKYGIIADACLEWSFLESMGLSEGIKGYITAMGWDNWLIRDVQYPVYRELCL